MLAFQRSPKTHSKNRSIRKKVDSKAEHDIGSRPLAPCGLHYSPKFVFIMVCTPIKPLSSLSGAHGLNFGDLETAFESDEICVQTRMKGTGVPCIQLTTTKQ